MSGEDRSATFSEKIRDALIKKAMGYDVKEVVEEYSEEDGEIRLVKKKVTLKNVPPDVTALKMLMEETEGISSLSDEELKKEKERLLKELSEEEKIKKEKKKCSKKDSEKTL